MRQYRPLALLPLIISLLVTACKTGSNEPEHSYEYVPLSQFSIDTNALESGSTVQIIAYSGGKQSGKGSINYFQFIVVSEGAHDTVRVLAALINVPGETDKGTYTTPSMFDGDKGVFTATFEPVDSMQNKIINLSTVIGEKDRDLERVKEIMSDSSNTASGEEWVAVNKSLPIFENPNYKTTIGTLKFSSVPW